MLAGQLWLTWMSNKADFWAFLAPWLDMPGRLQLDIQPVALQDLRWMSNKGQTMGSKAIRPSSDAPVPSAVPNSELKRPASPCSAR